MKSVVENLDENLKGQISDYRFKCRVSVHSHHQSDNFCGVFQDRIGHSLSAVAAVSAGNVVTGPFGSPLALATPGHNGTR